MATIQTVTRLKTSRSRRLLLALAGAVCLPCAALADPFQIIFQDITQSVTTAGSLSFAGGSNPLTGTAGINTVTGVNAAQNSGSYAVTNGTYQFQTGAFDAAKSSQGVYVFDPGGFFLLTGGVSAMGLPDGSNLASVGAIGGTLGAVFDAQSDVLTFTIQAGFDVKNPALLSFFGYSGTPVFFYESVLISGPLSGVSSTDPNPSFSNLPVVTGIHDPTTGTTTYSTVVNTALVPEPASLVLLGTCIVLVTGRLRRRDDNAR